jgi:hypothetical protein
MEFSGHWLWLDWALMRHHTENHDHATTTVVGYPAVYSHERRHRNVVQITLSEMWLSVPELLYGQHGRNKRSFPLGLLMLRAPVLQTLSLSIMTPT